MPEERVLPGLEPAPTKYPGWWEPPPELVEKYPNGYSVTGAEYAQELARAAADRKFKWDGSMGRAFNYMLNWGGRSCSVRSVSANVSPDGLNAIEVCHNNVVAMRLRRDGLLTCLPSSEPIMVDGLLLNREMATLMAISYLGATVCGPTRGVALPDPTISSGKVRLSCDQLRLLADGFRSDYPAVRGRGGNNYYDFTDVVVDRHPSLVDQCAIMFVLKKPVSVDGCVTWLGAEAEGAIVAEIRDDGVLTLNSGWADPVQSLGRKSGYEGGEFAAHYSSQLLWSLWLTALALLRTMME